MSTKNSLTEEEFESLKILVSAIQGLQMEVGGIEAQKHLKLHELVIRQEELQKMQVALKDTYGDVTVNLQDGTFETKEETVLTKA